MINRKFFLCMLIACCVVACNTDSSRIDKKLEELFKVDVPDGFKVVNYDEGGLNDYAIRYDIEFDKKDFQVLLSELDLSKWENMNQGLYSKKYSIDDRSYEYIEIFTKKNRVTYMYIYE